MVKVESSGEIKKYKWKGGNVGGTIIVGREINK